MNLLSQTSFPGKGRTLRDPYRGIVAAEDYIEVGSKIWSLPPGRAYIAYETTQFGFTSTHISLIPTEPKMIPVDPWSDPHKPIRYECPDKPGRLTPLTVGSDLANFDKATTAEVICFVLLIALLVGAAFLF